MERFHSVLISIQIRSVVDVGTHKTPLDANVEGFLPVGNLQVEFEISSRTLFVDKIQQRPYLVAVQMDTETQIDEFDFRAFAQNTGTKYCDKFREIEGIIYSFCKLTCSTFPWRFP